MQIKMVGVGLGERVKYYPHQAGSPLEPLAPVRMDPVQPVTSRPLSTYSRSDLKWLQAKITLKLTRFQMWPREKDCGSSPGLELGQVLALVTCKTRKK